MGIIHKRKKGKTQNLSDPDSREPHEGPPDEPISQPDWGRFNPECAAYE